MNRLLRDVSRSFYLSLRLLPGRMRDAAATGYLLARLSDTIADCGAPVETKKRALAGFAGWLEGGDEPEVSGFRDDVEQPGEKVMLARADEVFRLLPSLAERERELVREVVTIIVSGQAGDLERFGGGGGVMPDSASLEDYTWRVAGCVGEFWTKLGFLTCGRGFSDGREGDLLALGRSFGMGLQLVNILRDVREDLANGRCYLPGCDPGNPAGIREVHGQLTEVARARLRDGLRYALAMKSTRLRAAALLPARLGLLTLDALARDGNAGLGRRVKLSRRVVYRELLGAFLGGNARGAL